MGHPVAAPVSPDGGCGCRRDWTSDDPLKEQFRGDAAANALLSRRNASRIRWTRRSLKVDSCLRLPASYERRPAD